VASLNRSSSSSPRWKDFTPPASLVSSGEKERDLALLRPCPAEWMTAATANPYVNDAGHEGPQWIEPAADQASLFGTGA